MTRGHATCCALLITLFLLMMQSDICICVLELWLQVEGEGSINDTRRDSYNVTLPDRADPP